MKTELGNAIAESVGMKEAAVELDDSVKGVTAVVCCFPPLIETKLTCVLG